LRRFRQKTYEIWKGDGYLKPGKIFIQIFKFTVKKNWPTTYGLSVFHGICEPLDAFVTLSMGLVGQKDMRLYDAAWLGWIE
jgi:hypothetical protein